MMEIAHPAKKATLFLTDFFLICLIHPVPILSFQAQNCLTSLYKLDKVQFRQTMREYVNKDSLNNIVDFLHALLGFCMEPITDSKYGGVCEWDQMQVVTHKKICICATNKCTN